jgi:hypothetical protein
MKQDEEYKLWSSYSFPSNVLLLLFLEIDTDCRY